MARGEDNATYAAIQRALERGAVALQADADLERTLRGFDLRPRPPEDVLAGMVADGVAWPDTDPGAPLRAVTTARARDILAGPAAARVASAGTDLDWTTVAAAAAPSSGFSFPASLARVQAALGIQTVAGTPVAGTRPIARPTIGGWGAGDRGRVNLPAQPEIHGRICAVAGVIATTPSRALALNVRCLGKGREHLTAEVPLDPDTGAVLGDALARVGDEVQAAFIIGDRVKVTLASDERCGEAGTVRADWERDPDTTGVWVHLDADPDTITMAYHPDWLDRLHEEPPEAPATAAPAAAPRRATLVIRYADGEERRTTGSAGEIAAARAALATVPGVTWEEVAE